MATVGGGGISTKVGIHWYSLSPPNDRPNLINNIRLGLIVYAFDAFISVLHDEKPNMRIDELNLRFPHPEEIFMAASEGEWRDASLSGTQNAAGTFSVSLTLSSLFCDVAVPLPDTLMGRFVLLNGMY